MKTFLLLCMLGLTLPCFAQEVVFIAHPSTSETSLTADDAKNILLGTKGKWNSGAAIKLAVLANGDVHETVMKTYLQRSADQFDKYWKKQVFTGKGIMPATPASEAEMVAYVAANPGAFGYVSRTSVTDAVKILAVPSH